MRRTKVRLWWFVGALVCSVVLWYRSRHLQQVPPIVAEIPRSVRLARLLQWARENGAYWSSSVELVSRAPAGWGVIAAVHMAVGEIVCMVPKKVAIFPEREGSPILSLAEKLLRNLDHPYINSLPWESVDPFRPSEFDDQLKDSIAASDEEWDAHLYNVAVKLVVSRIHRAYGSSFVLVPLCDMFNTATSGDDLNVECKLAPEDETILACRATRDIHQGQDLLVMYRAANGEEATASQLRNQYMIDG